MTLEHFFLFCLAGLLTGLWGAHAVCHDRVVAVAAERGPVAVDDAGLRPVGHRRACDPSHQQRVAVSSISFASPRTPPCAPPPCAWRS